MFKAKISVIGPCESGKTVLSNFLGDQTDNSQGEYTPTVGVRILEFETSVENSTIDVELWDCSGNTDFEGCWPAMAYQADGIIIVFDPFGREWKPAVENFYEKFVANKGLKPNHCLIFANNKQDGDLDMQSPIPGVTMANINLEKSLEEVRSSFISLLHSILDKLSDSRDRQELSIIA